MAVKQFSEHEIQSYLCKYMKLKNIKFLAIPNGFIHNGDKMQTIRYMAYLRAEGYVNGSPDIVIFCGNGQVCFLEVKTPKGKPRKEQLEWQKYFDKNGYNYKICYGLKECLEFVDSLEVNNV